MMIYFTSTLTYFFSERYSPRDIQENSNSSRHSAAAAVAAEVTPTPNPFHSWLDEWRFYCYQPQLFLNPCTKRSNFSFSKTTNFCQANHYICAHITCLPTVLATNNEHYKQINCQFQFTPLDHFTM